MTTKNFRLSFQLILGFIIIALGVLYLLQNLGFLYARDYTRYWPILIALYGLSRIIQSDAVPQKIWGGFWTFVGTIWFLDKLDVLYFDFIDFWPLVLVALGLSLIWGTSRRRAAIAGGTTVEDGSSTFNAFALLGGYKRSINAQDFRSGEATAIMGGCELDLSKASIKEGEAVLNLVAIMGGVEIRVPEDWRVVLQGVPILGAFEDETRQPGPESTKRLVVRGYAVMGGVEIKN